MSRNQDTFQPTTTDGEQNSENPYSYTSSSVPQAQAQAQSSDDEDPEITKLKSTFWRRFGQLETTVGNWTGIESLESTGKSYEAWGEHAYRQADDKRRAGAPSRAHGEYNRIAGMVGAVVGHVIGDPMMQAESRLRVRESEEELERCKK